MKGLIDFFLPFKRYLLIGGLVLAVGGTAWFVRSHYVSEIESINAKNEIERLTNLDMANQAIIAEKDKASTIKDGFVKLEKTIVEIKNSVEKRGLQNVKEITERKFAASPGGSDGRVFIDPGSSNSGKDTTCQAPGTASPTPSESASSPRRLSDETTKFLLEYGGVCETMRRDLLNQIEYGQKTKKAYDDMLSEFDKVKP